MTLFGPFGHSSFRGRVAEKSTERACLGRSLPVACGLWNKLGPCEALAILRDFVTAGTCRRPRIALARFPRSRPTEAAFVFHALADPNVADREAASNLGGDA